MGWEPKFTLLFVLGIGRSGSTLFGRLLANHPDVVNVGELLRVEETLGDPEANCACGMPVATCPEWNHLLEGVPEEVLKNYKKWTPDLLERIRMNGKARLLVDVSKTRGYRLAKRWRDPRVGFVLLLRNPRGIFRSHVAEGKDLVTRLKMHKKWMVRLTRFASKRADRCLIIHYEDLVTAPEATLRMICEFVGLDYQSALGSPDAAASHMAVYSGSSYMKGTGKLRLDERWRQELSGDAISCISRYLCDVPIYQQRYRLSETV
jgi:hypothetical protein